MMFNSSILLLLVFLHAIASNELSDEAPTNSSGYFILSPYPPYVPNRPEPILHRYATWGARGREAERYKKDHAAWIEENGQQKKEYEERKAKVDAEYIKRINEANDHITERRLKAVRDEIETYFKPVGYNGTSPNLFSRVRALFWDLKNRFGDRGSKEGQLLSDIFKKYGYIAAELDFPSSSISNGSTSPKTSVISTSIPEVTGSDKPATNSTVDVYLLEKKYGKVGLIMLIAIVTLIAILILLSICVMFVLLVWLAKIICCKKKRRLNEGKDNRLRPNKLESQTQTKDSFSVETPMSSKRTIASQMGSVEAPLSSKGTVSNKEQKILSEIPKSQRKNP